MNEISLFKRDSGIVHLQKRTTNFKIMHINEIRTINNSNNEIHFEELISSYLMYYEDISRIKNHELKILELMLRLSEDENKQVVSSAVE